MEVPVGPEMAGRRCNLPSGEEAIRLCRQFLSCFMGAFICVVTCLHAMHFPVSSWARTQAPATCTAQAPLCVSAQRVHLLGPTAPLCSPASPCHLHLNHPLPCRSHPSQHSVHLLWLLQIYPGASSPAVDRLCVGVRPGEVGGPQAPLHAEAAPACISSPLKQS